MLFALVDDIAESFLDVVDTADGEIDELEAHMEEWTSDRVRRRIAGLRHDVLHARGLVPTLIVGFYGQNFEPVFDARYWDLGVTTALIAVTTIVQLARYRWRRWI